MITVREMTDCYKCGAKMMAEVGLVHPLCDNCNGDFEAWFAEQLKMFNG